MLKDLADFPQLFEALINSVVGFLYRSLGTFWAILRSPRYGALRAYVSATSLKPLTALFLTSGLLATASALFPDQVGGLIENRNADIVSWLLYTFSFLLLADAAINAAGLIGWRRGRRRRRAIAMLRYAASFAFLAMFLCALEWRWETHTMLGVAPIAFKWPVRPWWIGPLQYVLILMPLIGTAAVLAGLPLRACRHAPESALPQQATARWPWRRITSFLPVALIVAIIHMPADTFAIVDVPKNLADTAKEEKRSTKPFPDLAPMLKLSPVACSVSKSEGHFSAAVANSTDELVFAKLDKLEIRILERNISLLDPKAAHLPATVRGPMVIALAPKSAIIVEGSFKLPANLAKLNLNACFFDDVMPNPL